jgi:Ca-activated chloride channel homolog
MDFTHPHFAEPGWLWLALLAPLALVVLHRYAAWGRRRQIALFSTPQFVEELTRSHSAVRRAVKHALLVLAAAGMGMALARPQWGERENAGQILGEDVLFALDCSRSMLAADVAPNRLRRAKLAVLNFVQRHGRGRVGLVAFAGQAFLQCPLTFDYGAFEDALLATDERAIAVPGTDLGRALDESFRAMEKTDRKKLIVLLTDGEDLAQDGVRTAESLAAKGIVVYTIGVGTPSGAEIKVPNARGQMEWVRDERGEIVRSRLDEKTLDAIAQATHGGYHPLGPLGEGLAKVRVDLETADHTGGAASARKIGVERFHYPLAAVLVLLVAESLTGTRRRERRAAASGSGQTIVGGGSSRLE